MFKVTIQGIQFDANSSFMRGPASAPNEIRNAIYSRSANMWTESNVDLQGTSFEDIGDLDVNDLESEEAFPRIEEQTRRLLEAGNRVLTFGGDHSIVNPIISAYTAKYGKINVLHIDAHGDIYENFDNNPYSHASPFARLLEKGAIARLVQYGQRTLTGPQREQCVKYGVETFEMKDWPFETPAISFGNDPFYISLDLDAMDPAFCPGVSHYEPGGLTSRQVIQMINTVPGRLVGADIVELNPLRDINGMTAMVGARMAKELLARLITR